jgi:hypothetical protein
MNQTDATTLTVTCVALAAQLWSLGLPERSTVASWPADPGRIRSVNTGSVTAGAAAMCVAAGASWATRSWWPVLASAVVVAYLGAVYGQAARSGPATAGECSVQSTPSRQSVRWIA